MAIQLVFSKSDDTPWGFRLTGGADCEIPLTVIKIVEGGIAKAAGLQVDDVILKINEYSTEDLSHMEAHDVLMEAGSNFTMTIIRNYSNLHEEEQHNDEVRNILQQCSQNVQKDCLYDQKDQNGNVEDSKNSVSALGNLPQQKTLRVHFEEAQVDFEKETELSCEQMQGLQQKKWSTFLQKPNRPVVSPKKTDLEKHVTEPYRVIIKKQPKKNTEEVENVCHEEHSVEIEIQNTALEGIECPEEEYLTVDEELNEENVEFQEQQQDNEEEHPDCTEIQSNEEIDTEEETPLSEEVEVEKHALLEEQLAQIQQQLQLLAHVPTSIQDTLEALTEQLARIVGTSQTQANVEQQTVLYENNDDVDEERSYEDENLPLIIEETAEAADLSDEYKLDMTDATDISEDEEDDDRQATYTVSPEDELKLRQEEELERERQKLELEKSAKQERIIMQTEEFHQRRLEQRPTVPLVPVQRPIILPGGRKWSEPNDAVPKPRKSKMTDEKICETLDNYSEVVTGHTKGINFLKYQPAPKNLDYLQRSEVFRLVHDMDPPGSGIAARSGLIVSEEDYYRDGTGQRASVKA